MTQMLLELETEQLEAEAMENNDNSNKVLSLADRITAERIEKSLAQPFNIRTLAKKPERLNFNLVIQRNLRWTHEQKTSLIESILLGFPIPPVYTLKSQDNQFWLLDGKQRLSTLVDFRNNQWELGELTDVYGVDITGCKFLDLPEEFQELIEEQNITFYQFERLTTEQRDQLFKRLNSGTPLSAIELIRSILGTENLEYINTLIETPFVTKVGVTDKQREGFKDVEMVLQMISVITARSFDVGGKSLTDIALDLRVNGLTEKEKETITEVFKYLGEAFTSVDDKTAKKVLKKSDIIGITGVAVDSPDHPEDFSKVITTFISSQGSGSAYKSTTGGGSAGAKKVKSRIDILKDALAKAR